MTETPNQRRGFVEEAMRNHLGLAISGLLVVLTILHVMWVALFDPTVTMALLGVADRTQLLIATVALGITSFLPVFAGFWRRVAQFVHRKQTGGSLRDEAIGGLTIFLGVPLFFGAVPIVVLAGVTLGEILGSIRLGVAKKRGTSADPPAGLRSTYNFLLVTVVGVILVTLLSKPWVPSESLLIEGADEPKTYFVIGSEGDRTLLLSADRRSITWVDHSAIKERTICNRKSAWWAYPLPAVVLKSNVKSCPTKD